MNWKFQRKVIVGNWFCFSNHKQSVCFLLSQGGKLKKERCTEDTNTMNKEGHQSGRTKSSSRPLLSGLCKSGSCLFSGTFVRCFIVFVFGLNTFSMNIFRWNQISCLVGWGVIWFLVGDLYDLVIYLPTLWQKNGPHREIWSTISF